MAGASRWELQLQISGKLVMWSQMENHALTTTSTTTATATTTKTTTTTMTATTTTTTTMAKTVLGSTGANLCPASYASADSTTCLAAAQQLLPGGQQQTRTSLQSGSFSNVPPGCSVQSGGDWAAHYVFQLRQAKWVGE
eukprot:TRINITY_DN1989_c0_g1_i7.p3 TRINITY_DN1989_c0_g1~~TRINITY_DN1989_c0_g1_i7.p3  ORF type:complete len:139 (-),score=24.81 TRINITY_DN1989_c0_g1_i7:334-750(-)